MTEEEIKQQLQAEKPDFDSIPDFLKDDHWYEVDVDGDFLDFQEPYRPPRYILSHDGVKFANIGDLHVVSGKAGHGKTNLMSQLMAAILSGQFGNIRYEMSEAIPKPIVLYIDTEQGKDDTIAIKNRVCELAGLDYRQPQEQFKILRLRDTEEAADRWRKILKAVWLIKPNVVFLDGMLDIVNDYNDQKECQPIVRKCMMLATHYDVSLWMVLHENPMADKLVGTLGSITQRKVTEVFTVRKHKRSEETKFKPNRPDIYFTVTELKARGRDVNDWDFEVIPGAAGWGMPREIIDVPELPTYKTKHTIEEVKEWITDGQSRLDWPATHSDFFSQILVPNGIEDKEEQRELLNMAVNRGFIQKQTSSEMKKGQITPRLKLNPNEILPFGEQKEDCEF